jgi:hypothetical protein
VAIARDVLVEAVESSLFLLEDVPGYVQPLDVSGVSGRITSVSHPLANLVGMAALDEGAADRTIGQVHRLFAESRKAFGWVTSPANTPSDIGRRLIEGGLVKADEMAGMMLTELDRPIALNPQVEVRESTPDELRSTTGMMAAAYGMPRAMAELMIEMVLRSAGRVRFRGYLAYLPGRSEAVAFSNMMYLPHSPIVLLGGAATLPDFRGQGTYSAMVARRLADAHADGAEAAVIQAVRGTSAPICARLGFTEITPLEFYAWLPPGSDIDLHA